MHAPRNIAPLSSPQRPCRSARPWRRHALAAAVCAAVAGPATAAIVSTGSVSPGSVGSVVTGPLSIGNSGYGSVTVDAASLLTADSVGIGTGPSGVGDLFVQGAGSRVLITRAAGGNFDIGSAGDGALVLLDGGSLRYGGTGSTCALNCRTFIGNAAGSTGGLLVRGSFSLFETAGTVVAGQASVFRLSAGDSLDYGIAGGTTRSQVELREGGAARSSALVVAAPGGGTTARTGLERVISTVLVDGVGSAWNLVRDAAQTGARAVLAMATGSGTDATVNVANGGKIRVDGTAVAGEFTGINVAANAATSTGSSIVGRLNVAGAGSAIEFSGGRGFLNVGRGGGAVGELQVTGGGQVLGLGDGETGLTYLGIGRGGGTGTATVSGTGSLVRLNGVNSATNSDPGAVLNGGAFLSVGRSDSGIAGTGTFHVLAGGRAVVDTAALALTNPNGQTGFGIGWDAGSVGTVNVSGAGSQLLVMAGTGLAPYAAVGRNGGNGTLNITAGAEVRLSGARVSTPNPGSYLPGDVLLFEVGRRTTTDPLATLGQVTVGGAGSQLVLDGAVDSLLFVGRGANASGTLNVLSGGRVQSKALLVGDAGGVGTLTVNAGSVALGGLLAGGPSAGTGGGMTVGRGGGVATVNLGNGAVLSVDGGSAPSAGVRIGGNATVAGGTGTVNLTGGASMAITGPGAGLSVGAAGTSTDTGTGTLNLSGAGSSVSVTGAGARVLVGAAAHTSGTVNVGAGSTLATSGFIGVAHDGTASSSGSGRLIVNGQVNATTVYNGSNGYIGGTGTITGDVVNLGTINPGNSPGKLVVNGNFDNRGGTLVLEVKYNPLTGEFEHDEIVFGTGASVDLDGSTIDFQFLDGTDPTAFIASGALDLDTFFKVLDSTATEVDISSSALMADLFDAVSFSGSAGGYSLSSFSFDAATGSIDVTASASAVPLPATLPLALLGLGALGLQRRRRALG